MGVQFGDKPVSEIWYGDKSVRAVYRGTQQIWPLNVWVGTLVASSILSGNVSLARAIAGGLVSVSDLAGDVSRLRMIAGSIDGVSDVAGVISRMRSASGNVVSNSAMQGTVNILTLKLIEGSIDAVSALAAAASRDRNIVAALVATSTLSGSAVRSRNVSALTASISSIDTVTALRNRLISAAMSSASGMSASATVESPAVTDFSFLDKATEGTNTSDKTYSGLSFGAADDDRWILVDVFAQSGGGADTPTAVTIGGVTGTELVSSKEAPDLYVGIWIAAVPTGTTGDIRVQLSGSPARQGIGWYRMLHSGDPTTPHDAASGVHSSGVVSLSINTKADGALMVFSGTGNANTTTFSGPAGLTEDFDIDAESNDYMAGASLYTTSAVTGQSVTVTNADTTPGFMRAVAVSF